MLLAQRPLPYFYYPLRQLQCLLSLTRLAVFDSETVHRAEGVEMLLAQRPLPYFYHPLRQLQRLLDSTHLAIYERKPAGHPLTVVADVSEVEYSFLPKP